MEGEMTNDKMNSDMMNNQMSGQMMNAGMMNNQMGAQMMNAGMMNNQMGAQMMNAGMMNNQMGAQMMNAGMMNNQMTGQLVPAGSTELMESYSIDDDIAKMEKEMINSAEVLSIASVFEKCNNIEDLNEIIIAFGQEAAEPLGLAADGVLKNKTRADLMRDNSSGLMNTLGKIISDLNPAALHEAKGLFKIFTDMKKKIDMYFAKYQSVEGDINKIVIDLKRYEEEAKVASRDLLLLFNGNVNSFHELQKYIFAGDVGVKKLDQVIAEMERQFNVTQSAELSFQLKAVRDARETLATRVLDLRTVRQIANASILQLKTMQNTNNQLIRIINTSFLISLPAFKQGIAQAIILRQQEEQAKAFDSFKKTTEQLLVSNAQKSSETAARVAELSSSSFISVDVLQEQWNIITNGIDQVNKIQDEAKKKREEDTVKLENLKQEFYQKFGRPSHSR